MTPLLSRNPLKKRVQLNAFSFFSYGMVNTLRFGLFSVLNVSFYDFICVNYSQCRVWKGFRVIRELTEK